MSLLKLALTLDHNWGGNFGCRGIGGFVLSFNLRAERLHYEFNQFIVGDVTGRGNNQIVGNEISNVKVGGDRTIERRDRFFGAFDRTSQRMIRKIRRVKKLGK